MQVSQEYVHLALYVLLSKQSKLNLMLKFLFEPSLKP